MQKIIKYFFIIIIFLTGFSFSLSSNNPLFFSPTPVAHAGFFSNIVDSAKKTYEKITNKTNNSTDNAHNQVDRAQDTLDQTQSKVDEATSKVEEKTGGRINENSTWNKIKDKVSDIGGSIQDKINDIKDKITGVEDKVDNKDETNSDESKPETKKPSLALGLSVEPKSVQENGQLTIKSYGLADSAKTNVVLVTKPNVSFEGTSAASICKYLPTLPNDKIQARSANDCENGGCNLDTTFTVPPAGLNKSYQLQIVNFISSQSKSDLLSKCNSGSILKTTGSIVTVGGGSPGNTDDGSTSGELYGPFKGTIRLNAPSLINQGDSVMINAEIKGHKGDEMMLWISDCDGTLVPKILISDHANRTIPDATYHYNYLWDTAAAQTKTCKHIVQLKTFAKTADKWVWNDMAKYEITVGQSKATATKICTMQIDEGDAKDNEASTVTVENGSYIVKGNNVFLTWGGVCGSKYYIYRNDELIGTTQNTNFTDTLDSSGNYIYRIDAYLGEGPSTDTINSTDGNTDTDTDATTGDDTSGGNNNYDDNMSYRSLMRKMAFFGINQVNAANPTPVSSKIIKTTVTIDGEEATGNSSEVAADGSICGIGETKLGVPIPVKNSYGGGYHMDYCATLKEWMTAIYNFLIIAASLGAVLMIIFGGYVYITSDGEPQKTTMAKEIIMGALIGLALLLSASLLISTFGVS